MVFSDIYLQPDATDPVLAEEVVVETAHRHSPDAGGLLEVDESGGEARAYLLEGGIVMKTQRPHRLRLRTSLRKEALFLVELERQGHFLVPRALGHGEIDGIEYLCLTRIEGTTVERSSLDSENRAGVLRELGRTLRAIHGLDQSVIAESGLMPGDRSNDDLRTRISDTFARLSTALEHDHRFADVLDIRKLAAERIEHIREDERPVSLHSNPGPEHTFVDAARGSFTGLIDFGDAYRSHPAFDLRPWSGEGDAEAVFDGYRSVGPLSPGFEEMWRTVLVIGELGRAARSRRAPDELRASLDRLLG